MSTIVVIQQSFSLDVTQTELKVDRNVVQTGVELIELTSTASAAIEVVQQTNSIEVTATAGTTIEIQPLIPPAIQVVQSIVQVDIVEGNGAREYTRVAMDSDYVYRGAEGWGIYRWRRPAGSNLKQVARYTHNPYTTLDEAWANRASLVYV